MIRIRVNTDLRSFGAEIKVEHNTDFIEHVAYKTGKRYRYYKNDHIKVSLKKLDLMSWTNFSFFLINKKSVFELELPLYIESTSRFEERFIDFYLDKPSIQYIEKNISRDALGVPYYADLDSLQFISVEKQEPIERIIVI
jgi:hypothetical protein